MKKKIMAVGALLCAGVMTLSLAACSSGKEAEAASYVSLDINPSIELTLDKNNKVLSVYGGNEDGQVLLYNEVDLVGVDVEKAVEKITSLAVKYGYLDENNKVVETSVTSAKAELAESLLDKINTKVTATAGDLHLSVTCEGVDEAFSLARKLDQIKKQYPDNAAVQSLTPEKLKLVLSATEDGEISVEAAAELDTSELIKKVSETHNKVEEFATAAYRKVKATASAAYDIAVGDASDAVYTTYYAVKHPLNSYYAFSYTGYKYSARALNATADALVYVQKACDYPLNGEQVTAAATALGITDVEALKNSDGEITVNSIYAYADKTFKNSEASAQIEEIKTQLNAALDTVEGQLQEKVAELSAEYEDEITAVKDKMNAVAAQINNLIALAPESVKTQMQTIATDCKEIAVEVTEIVKDGKITADEVRALANKLDKKANDTLAKIEADMTKEELEEVKKLQDNAVNALTGAKTQMEKAISDAEAQAKARLEALKAKRSSK